MLFIPYRPRVKLTRIPVFTLLVTVLSLAIYTAQSSNEEAVYESARAFCTKDVAVDIEYTQKHYIRSDWKCDGVLGHIYLWNHMSKHLDWHLKKIREAGDEERAKLFEEYYEQFSAQAPRFLTARLWQWRGSWNPLRMLSGTFSHGSWDHVIGNLFFFVSFSLVVELILGPFLYLFVFVVMALGIGAVDNLASIGQEMAPTLGLSGVVMGMLAMAVFFAPKVKINYFYFFFLYIGVWSIPLWALAGWYIGWNILDNLYAPDWSRVNYVAHLAGAMIGLGLGITLFRDKRHWVDNLVVDEKDPLEDETWLYQLNIIGTMPVVLFFGFLVYLMAMTLLVEFITTFAVQLFMLAPVVAAGVHIYRSKRSERPDWERFQSALYELEKRRFPVAVKALEDLAQRGYTRAQVVLARLYLQGRGVHKLYNQAERWYRSAANAGNRDAQYGLALMLTDARAVQKSNNEYLQWYEKAADQGLPEAAMSLGHIHENGKSVEVDKDSAANWYYRAAKSFLREGRLEDARAAYEQLKNVASDSVLVDRLETDMRG